MKNVIRIVNVFIGCLLIALSLNFIILPNNLLPFGLNGLASIIYYFNGVNPAINIFIFNTLILLIASLVVDKKVIKFYLLPSILIPIMVFITSPLTSMISFELPEMVLVVLVAGFLSGTGYSYIYKQGYSAGVIFLFEEMMGKLTGFHSKAYSWIVDVIILINSFFLFGYQTTLYSFCIIFVSKYMITKARFGINDSKMFYIITQKEKEVKDYIIHDLKYELTVLDVKGGFSKQKNRILLTVISTEDYYKLKEGIKIIDPKSFIAITDTYDVVNRKSF